MWTRKDLKLRAKDALRGHYWLALAAVLVTSVLAVICTNASQMVFGVNASMDAISQAASPEEMLMLLIEKAPSISGSYVISLLVSIFFLYPLSVGLVSFFIRAAKGEHSLSNIWSGFKGNYKNVVWTIFKRDLFVYLWSLLFVIPGIIKSFQYAMAEYILAENPDMPSKEVLLTSKEMMKGNKWKYFVLALSFIGWLLLGSLVFGIGTLFVVPYMQATFVQFYLEIKSQKSAQVL